MDRVRRELAGAGRTERMTPRITAFSLTAVLALGGSQAAAQTGTGWKSLWYVAVDGGMQVTSTSATSTVRYKVYGEDAVLKVTYRTEPVPVFSARGGVRIWRRLTIGAGVTGFTDSAGRGRSTVATSVFFQRPRTIEGSADAITAKNSCLCGGGLDCPHPFKDGPPGVRRARLFQREAGDGDQAPLCRDIPLRYGVVFGRPIVREQEERYGLHRRADFTYRLSTHVGVGGLLRFSRPP